ncbi:MAG TPA: hypothetical protein DC049_14640 [Spirochaetia bacterium]|nr:hypothetical protein [Spirochaetia bacterium]
MKETSLFDAKCDEIATQLFLNSISDENITDILKEIKLNYYSLLDKIKILEKIIDSEKHIADVKVIHNYFMMILESAADILTRPRLLGYFDMTYAILSIDCGQKEDTFEKIWRLIKESSQLTDFIARDKNFEIHIMLPSTSAIGAKIYLDKIFRKITETGSKVSGGGTYFNIPFNVLQKIGKDELKEQFEKIRSRAREALTVALKTGSGNYEFVNESK